MLAYCFVKSEILVEITKLITGHTLNRYQLVTVKLNGISVLAIIVPSGNKINFFALFFELIQSFSEAYVTLVLASVNQVAGNKNNICILVLCYLLKACVNYRRRLGNAFLVGYASFFVSLAHSLERAVVIMSVSYEIKAEIFHNTLYLSI